jgi:quercetin dioxygenase-like cupin family protein
MKVILSSALFLLALSVSAQAPAPAPLAHGDMPGEPHHHLKIENEYVRVYYVEVPPHENTQLHQHDHDYLFVTLGDSDVINAVRDKPEVHLVLKDGETHFTRGGFAHVARNLSDAPFRNVTIELLHPQGTPRNRCGKVIDGPLNSCPEAGQNRDATALRARDMPTPAFETDEILVSSVSVAARVGYIQSGLQSAQLLVALDAAGVRVDVHGNPSKNVHGGEALWLPSGIPPAIFSLGEQGKSRFLLIAFKNGNS